MSANYPLEFYTSLLTIDASNTDDVRRYIKAVKDRGFKIEAPNINTSEVGFSISGDAVVFGLLGIKGVGNAVSTKILKRRPKKGYDSFGKFLLKNVDILNKKIIEAYAKAGAFSPFANKNTVLYSIDNILEFISLYKDLSDYYSIFDIAKINIAGYIDHHKLIYSSVPDDLKYEIETLGLYITKHPMEDFVVNNEKKAVEINNISKYYDGDRVLVPGAISSIEVRKTKAKANMASFDLTDALNSVKCLVFPKVYSQFQNALSEGKIIAVRGTIKEEDDNKFISVNEIIDSESILSKLLCPITKRKDDPYNGIRWYKKVSDIKDESTAGLIINKDLSFILRRS